MHCTEPTCYPSRSVSLDPDVSPTFMTLMVRKAKKAEANVMKLEAEMKEQHLKEHDIKRKQLNLYAT